KTGYATDGSRLVCGVVAVSKDKRKILVVESTQRKNHWVLPKGGFETDEATPEDAALREAWEEAGITGRITRALGEIPDPRINASISNNSLFMFFEVDVEREEARWPEMQKRMRRWLTFDEATKCFQQMGRPELLEAVKRSSVLR
ncbi:hypothetical protein L211DRAFT_768887, partial [Terfezia boudieri ATCC MYA-4762]